MNFKRGQRFIYRGSDVQLRGLCYTLALILGGECFAWSDPLPDVFEVGGYSWRGETAAFLQDFIPAD